jgi:hypothetical protein
MPGQNQPSSNALRLFLCWLVVGVPLVWGIWNTVLKLPALFK